MSFTPLEIRDGLVGGEEPTEQQVKEARENELTPDERAEWREIDAWVETVLYGELEEFSYREFLHPRGRGGKWITKLGGPAREMSAEDWYDFQQTVQADPFSHVKPGDDAMPIVNALHQIDSGWTIKMSLNRSELPSGSLPEGVEGVTRFEKQVGSDEPPDSLVLHMRQKKDGHGLEIVNAGHGSMVWDHMIATPEQHADEVRAWRAEREKLAAERATRERAQAEAVGQIEAAVASGDGEALRRTLEGRSPAEASALLARAGLQYRERITRVDVVADTLRGRHGETVKVTSSRPPIDSFKEMEDAVDQALGPNGVLPDHLAWQAETDLRAEGDRRPDDPEEVRAWRARRDARVHELATQRYTWLGRADPGMDEYPDGLWAVLRGEDGNRYWVDWGGNLHLLRPDMDVIEGPREDRRLTEEQKRRRVEVEILPNPQGGRRTRLPPGQAPKDLDELLVDTLGRADELGHKYDTGVNVTAVVHDIVPEGMAAVHEWNGTISINERYLDNVRDYLSKRALAGGAPGVVGAPRLTDEDHLNFYNDLQILSHEINHGVGVNGGISSRNYQGLGVNVEEALTEETAHLEAADWLRSYGMTDVLEAVKRHPNDWRVRGTYLDYRTQLKKLMDDANLLDEQRREQLRRMKFQMSAEQQYAEIIRLAQLKRPRVTDLGAALPSPGLPPDKEFESVVRPDLSDIG